MRRTFSYIECIRFSSPDITLTSQLLLPSATFYFKLRIIVIECKTTTVGRQKKPRERFHRIDTYPRGKQLSTITSYYAGDFMETIQELKRVLEVNLNYLELSENHGHVSGRDEAGKKSLHNVRERIERVKRYRSFISPIVIALAVMASSAAIMAFIGITFLPWEKVGLSVLLLIPATAYVYSLETRIESLKKKELFIMMLNKIEGHTG